jgi:anaerobic selenocysteine-containing dehydrogenase
MAQYAFARTNCGMHYQVKPAQDLDALFDHAKHIFFNRERFDQYLQTAATLPEKFMRFTDPGPDPEEGFEILLGDYQAIRKYVRLQEEGIDEEEEID